MMNKETWATLDNIARVYDSIGLISKSNLHPRIYTYTPLKT